MLPTLGQVLEVVVGDIEGGEAGEGADAPRQLLYLILPQAQHRQVLTTHHSHASNPSPSLAPPLFPLPLTL